MIVNEILNTTEPVVLLLNHGEGVAADINKALDAATKDGLKVVKVNVNEQPDMGEHFEVGKHPVLVVWHCGEIKSRRPRPWATDVAEVIKHAKTLVVPAGAPAVPAPAATPEAVADDAPVHVTDGTFETLVMQSSVPVLVDFWAEWCGPCKMVAPILDKLAQEFKGKIRIAKVDVDANPGLSGQFRIQSIPTLMFVKNGKIVGMSAGAAPEAALRDAINQLINLKI